MRTAECCRVLFYFVISHPAFCNVLFIERESNQQNLVTWTYPTVANEISAYLKARCFPTQSNNKNTFFYLRKNNLWIYIKNFVYKEKLTALIVVTEEFVPHKYKLLCDILEKKYAKTNSPVELVKLYINLISGGSAYYQENGSEIGLNLKTFSTEVGIKGKKFCNAVQNCLQTNSKLGLLLNIKYNGRGRNHTVTCTIFFFGKKWPREIQS